MTTTCRFDARRRPGRCRSSRAAGAVNVRANRRCSRSPPRWASSATNSTISTSIVQRAGTFIEHVRQLRQLIRFMVRNLVTSCNVLGGLLSGRENPCAPASEQLAAAATAIVELEDLAPLRRPPPRQRALTADGQRRAGVTTHMELWYPRPLASSGANLTRTLITACALALSLSACKKKDDAQSAQTADDMKAGDKSSVPQPPGNSIEAVDKPSDAPAPTFANQAAYEAKTIPLFDAVVATYKADGTNCDKLGADLNKLVTHNHELFLSAVAWEHANPAANHVLAWSSAIYLTAAVPSINKCKANKPYADAMSMIPV